MAQQPAAYAITIGGRLYAYAENAADLCRQIIPRSMLTSENGTRLLPRIVYLDADAASETAECIAADATGWV